MIILYISKFIIKTFFSQYITVSGKNINFDDNKIRKGTFYKNKKINNIEIIDVNNFFSF